jgi:hypothetical protein
MNENPYASPNYQPLPPPFNPAQPAGNPLMIPAIFLLVFGGTTLLLILVSMPNQIMRMRAIDIQTPEGQGEMAGSIGSLVCWTAMTAAIMWGSIAMLRLRGYSNAMTAAVLAVIPICSPCFVLGIPFGIWAIVLLRRPEVRAMFA